MSMPNREAELFEQACEYWDFNVGSRASILVDSGYPLGTALNFFDTPFKNLNPWAQRAVTRTVTLMMENL